MKAVAMAALFLSIAASFWNGGRASRVAVRSAFPADSPSPPPRPVVVELFTSEGCSSCPPADALLAKLESAQPVEGAQIIAIEEHVDYWNQQGWIDPFSSPEWTDRQRAYVSAFRQDGEYTPQMVVDGRRQFVGSRMGEASTALREAQRSPTVDVAIRDAGQDGSAKEARFEIRVGKLEGTSPGDEAEVSMALTESGLESQVTGGENAGRSLRHASVLRALRKIANADGNSPAAFSGACSLKLKPGWKRANLTAVVLVQEKKSRRILGAAALGFSR
jgi:hypothetical protein